VKRTDGSHQGQDRPKAQLQIDSKLINSRDEDTFEEEEHAIRRSGPQVTEDEDKGRFETRSEDRVSQV
jgi:hypothetical protein